MRGSRLGGIFELDRKESAGIVGFHRFDSKAGKQAVRRDVMSDGMGHADTTYISLALVLFSAETIHERASFIYLALLLALCSLLNAKCIAVMGLAS